MSLFTGNALWQLIAQSDAISKAVLLILLVLSIISWAVFFYKLIMIRKKKKELNDALNQLGNVQSFDDLLALGYRLNTTAGG